MAVNQHGWYTPNERTQHVQSYLSSNLSLTQYSKENNLINLVLNSQFLLKEFQKLEVRFGKKFSI